MGKNGFFDSVAGNRSSSRLIGFIVIIAALIFAQEIIWSGSKDPMIIASAAGTIFITVAGPAMAFLFANKSQEIKKEVTDKQIDKTPTV